jgi:hypothetical protein
MVPVPVELDRHRFVGRMLHHDSYSVVTFKKVRGKVTLVIVQGNGYWFGPVIAVLANLIFETTLVTKHRLVIDKRCGDRVLPTPPYVHDSFSRTRRGSVLHLKCLVRSHLVGVTVTIPGMLGNLPSRHIERRMKRAILALHDGGELLPYIF